MAKRGWTLTVEIGGDKMSEYNLFEGDTQLEKVNAGKRVTLEVLTKPELALVVRIPREKVEKKIKGGERGSLILDEHVTYLFTPIV